MVLVERKHNGSSSHSKLSDADSKRASDEQAQAARAKRFGTRPGIVAFASFAGIGVLGILFHIALVSLSAPLRSLLLKGNAVWENAEFHTEEHVAKYTWGTYRPNVLFGLSTKTPQSPALGLMYLLDGMDRDQIRHRCGEDHETQFDWRRHDGTSFGEQVLTDKGGFQLHTSFLKTSLDSRGGVWTVRVTGSALTNEASTKSLSIIWYNINQSNQTVKIVPSAEPGYVLHSNGPIVGSYSVSIPAKQEGVIEAHYMTSSLDHVDQIGEEVRKALHEEGQGKKHFAFVDPSDDGEETKNNFGAIQLVVKFPFVVDMTYSLLDEEGDAVSSGVRGDVFSHDMAEKVAQYDHDFDHRIGLTKEKIREEMAAEGRVDEGVVDGKYKMAQSALSNLLGSIGYFYGTSSVAGKEPGQVYTIEASPLLTAVPSRAKAPIGRLAEEGYHLMLIKKWDGSIAREILAHWLDRINAEGFLMANHVLGEEAEAEMSGMDLVAHYSDSAPPTLLLAAESITEDIMAEEDPADDIVYYCQKVYFRVLMWMEWHIKSGFGSRFTGYHWSAREPSLARLDRPKSLGSGLPVFPRAAIGCSEERNVDLWVWLSLGWKTLKGLGLAVGTENDYVFETAHRMTSPVLLDRLHWSEVDGKYLDWGKPSAEATTVSPIGHLGYVSLHPLFMQLIEPDQHQLGSVLRDMRDPEQLWSNHGLRSLSKSSPLYQQPMESDGSPIWNGGVWLSANYLALRALRSYGERPGPHAEQAKKVYRELRRNVIENVYQVYSETGRLWEWYGVAPGMEGHGNGIASYNGGTSLVVLMMAENY